MVLIKVSIERPRQITYMKTKLKLPLIAALYCGLSAIGSAFTLDFSGITAGTALPQTINVAGYGSVTFISLGSPLTIAAFNPGSVNAVSFNAGDSIGIAFSGPVPFDVTNQYVGAGVGESFTFSATGSPNLFFLTLNNTPGASAGLQSIIFSQVPEPSSMVLGLITSSLLVLRRRR